MKNHLITKIGQYAIILKEKKLLLLTPAKVEYLMLVRGRLDEDENDYQISLTREVIEKLHQKSLM